jgi:ATP-binding cassette subfamily B multidrug efflux pump
VTQLQLSDIRFFLQYALRHKYSYILGIVALFASNWLVVNIPVHIGKSIDLLSTSIEQNYVELQGHVYTVIGFAVLMIFTRTLSRMLFFNPGRDLERELKNDTFTQLTMLQKSFYNQNDVGALISITNNDISGVRAMAGIGMMQIFNIGFALSLTPIKMWQISPTLMMYCILPIIVAFTIVNYSIGIMRQLMRRRMLDLQALSTSTVNFLNGVEVIKSHHIQPWAVGEFERDNQTLLDCSLKQLRIRTFFLPILEYTDGVLKILIIAVGGLYLIEETMTLGELTAFLTYATLLAMPFISFGRIISVFQMGLVSIKSIRRILGEDVSDLPPLIDSEQRDLFGSGIRVKNLSYAYVSPEDGVSKVPVLKNVSFDIKPGQKIAILGKVGSGKTTLVNCLNGYLKVSAGQVFVDDYDVAKLSRSDLRTAVRTITQEPFLFSDTIHNNIEFGSADRENVITIKEALYQSDMFDEVKQFPEAEETVVGEKGILLSGGQKQRLSLARGLFSPCKIIILDNVLSAVDNETERFLLTQIFENTRSQSTLIVSHRPEVLERVDLILMMDEGEIVARGSHRELLILSESYRETWNLLQESGSEASVEVNFASNEKKVLVND